MRSKFLKLTLCVAGMAALTVGAGPLAVAASPISSGAAPGRALSPSTRFFVPPPAAGAAQQILQLAFHRDVKDALLLTDMEANPQAVWFTGTTTSGATETPAQTEQLVRQTMFEAALERAVPVLVAYNIPGRDCAQYSAGGAATDAAYDTWVNAFAQGIGNGKAVVILEPDALANLPSYCSVYEGGTNPNYPYTDPERLADINYAVNTLEAHPNVNVYLDGGHSAWQSVGTIAQTLVEAGAQNAQGFFLDVSNYQYTQNNVLYGTWVSDCITYATVVDPGNYANCPNQYWNGGGPSTEIGELLGAYNGIALSPYGVWSDSTTAAQFNTSGIDAAYAGLLGTTLPTTHFVIDTSRNGNGPNDMYSFSQSPFDQPSDPITNVNTNNGGVPPVNEPVPAGIVATLVNGNWCDPPGSGLGLRPTANTSSVSSLLDAYLWVKTPGQSDGQCDAAGGVRAWDYTVYSQPGWPTTASTQALFDPLWGLVDPAAGAWFPQQALQLAQGANPSLAATSP